MNDKELRQNVIDELDFEPSIESANIGVAVENGVVTLSGHVPNYAQKLAAERTTWRVKGVKAIAQELQVRFPDELQCSDDEIAQRALSSLQWNVVVPRDSVQVRVQNGWVTLTGELDWNYQRDAAVSAVRKLAGVAGVVNEIVLRPGVQGVDVENRILNALKRHAEVEASQVKVTIRDAGTVNLEGAVDTWDERQAVVHAAWSTPGVRQVSDHLRIS